MYFKEVRGYKYKKVLGNGSYANVYLVEKDKHEYAMKEIKIDFDDPENESNQKMMEYFEQEIKIYKQIKHPNLVGFIEEFRDNSVIYCVQEYCSNGDLTGFLKKRKLNEKEIKNLFISLLSGMQYLYKKKIVHRDLKLDNILINHENNLKIADFGFAKYEQQGKVLTSYCGTPATMAPEVLNSEPYDHRCDIWSLGVILYYMIYRKYHWRGNIRSIPELQVYLKNFKIYFDDNLFQLSNEGKELLTKMLVSNVDQRINYEDLFKHPWLEGKLENQDQFLQTQQIISSQEIVTNGQLIGNEILKLRAKKRELNDLILEFIKKCECQEVKKQFQDFLQQCSREQFHVILAADKYSYDEDDSDLFDYVDKLQQLLSDAYLILGYGYKKTINIENKLLKFISENKLSNIFIFYVEDQTTLEELKDIKKTIVEQELKGVDSKIEIQIQERDLTEYQLIFNHFKQREFQLELGELKSSFCTKRDNPLR